MKKLPKKGKKEKSVINELGDKEIKYKNKMWKKAKDAQYK